MCCGERRLLGQKKTLFGTNLYDGNVGVFLLQAFDVRRQLQGLLIVTVPYTRVHQLRHLQDFEQLRVSLQGHIIHPPTVELSTKYQKMK
jgi:hypothetical protein